MIDARLDYPATTRNREPIWSALQSRLPTEGVVIEIASGSGQHINYFAQQSPHLQWQPTDYEAQHRASIAAWTESLACTNVRPPVELDVLEEWPPIKSDAMFCANMIHIAPWSCTPALFAGANETVDSGAPFFLYGPFMFAGEHTSESNAAFDASLRQRNPAWGIRSVAEVQQAARRSGFDFEERIKMPANNLMLVFRRR